MVMIDDVIVTAPEAGTLADPTAWFGSREPFELEIGSGKGGFLLHRARANPGILILGIEWANKYFRYSADRVARWGLTNVRVMRTDAREFVIRQLPPACVSILHVYHPDPWPKRRHHKRRLIQPDFVDAVVRVLVPTGLWLIQTDHAEYFEHIKNTVPKQPRLAETVWPTDVAAPSPAWAGTNFEVKYVREGRAIRRAAYQRTA